MWSAFLFLAIQCTHSASGPMQDPLPGAWNLALAPLRPRLSGNKASEEHQLRSDETNKNCAHTTSTCKGTDKEGETIFVISQERDRSWKKTCKHLSDHTGMGPFLKKTMSSHKKGTAPKSNRLLCHLTRKGTAPKQTDCCVISQERDCFLNR